jgi:hypothetical protein
MRARQERYDASERRLHVLERLDADELQGFLERTLCDGNPRPFRAWHLAMPEQPAYIALLRHYRASRDRAFQKRFRRAIVDLLRGWDMSIHTHEYACQLLHLVGLCNAAEARDLLYSLAVVDGGLFKGKDTSGGDLHLVLLRVLLGWDLDTESAEPPFANSPGRTEALCQRDIADRRYASICYRALWEISPENGIRQLPTLLGHAVEEEGFDLAPVLDQYIEALSPQALDRFIRQCSEFVTEYQNLVASHMLDMGYVVMTAADTLCVYRRPQTESPTPAVCEPLGTNYGIFSFTKLFAEGRLRRRDDKLDAIRQNLQTLVAQGS